MPSVSPKQTMHLERLNKLPQVKARRFQKGQKPWNAGTKVILDRHCEFCGKQFQIPLAQLNREAHHSGRFCSKECMYNFRKKYGIRAQIKELYERGKTYNEIGQILNKSPSGVAGQVYRMKIADRFGDGIYSTASKGRVRTLLKEQYNIEECELCGYDRTTEIAHTIEKKNGGHYLLGNCILLCPNCHHLFDHNGLTQDEKDKLLAINRLNGKLKERLYVAK